MARVTITAKSVPAAGKTHVLKASDIFEQSDGMFYIDCDVAASVLVLNF
jgi:hypothetical protein